MAKQIKIKHWKNGNDVCVSIEPFIAHLDHTKQESVQWSLDSPHTQEFSVEFPNTSPFADDKKRFDHNSPTSTHVQKKDKMQHKYNIVVDGVTIDPIIDVYPPN
jgi:hypothetical protein